MSELDYCCLIECSKCDLLNQKQIMPHYYDYSEIVFVVKCVCDNMVKGVNKDLQSSLFYYLYHLGRSVYMLT